MQCLTKNFTCSLVAEYMQPTEPRVNKNTIFVKSISSYARFLRNYVDDIFVSSTSDVGTDCTGDSTCLDGKICSKFKCTTNYAKIYDAFPLGIDKLNDDSGTRYSFSVNSKAGSSFVETESGLLSLFSSWTYSNYGTASLVIFRAEDPSIELALFLIFLIYASACTFTFIGVKKRYAFELP